MGDYHQLFCFNQFGDMEQASLRNGNVHSADDWLSLPEPIVNRYRGYVVKFYNKCGSAEQWIKEGKYALSRTRFSCHDFVDSQVRLQLFALAYNLGNFLRCLALPNRVREWSLRTLRVKLIKIGAKIVKHSRYVIFQMAEVLVSKRLFQEIHDSSRCRLSNPAIDAMQSTKNWLAYNLSIGLNSQLLAESKDFQY